MQATCNGNFKKKIEQISKKYMTPETNSRSGPLPHHSSWQCSVMLATQYLISVVLPTLRPFCSVHTCTRYSYTSLFVTISVCTNRSHAQLVHTKIM